MSCGTCATGEVCDSDGGCCTPSTCADARDAGLVHGCTPVDLGCGERQTCSPCQAGYVCDQTSGTCNACVPKTCANFGDAGCGHSDGCGKVLNCCPSGLTCQDAICCPPGQVQYNGSCCLPGCDPMLPPGPQVSCVQVIVCRG